MAALLVCRGAAVMPEHKMLAPAAKLALISTGRHFIRAHAAEAHADIAAMS
jgi:hypothetical protein